MSKETFQAFYELTKPGIIRGNLIAAIAGFLFASGTHIDLTLLAVASFGTILVIASGCVFNNYLDRDIDAHMARTKQRALVTGRISPKASLIFASILGLLGFWTLGFLVNPLTMAVGIVGLIAYVIMYGIAKRKTVYGTLVGSISGAVPPVAGYTAVANTLDASALILFLILVFWQMPHFYAISIFRAKDYAKAGIPVLSVAKGISAAQQQIIAYIPAFTLAAVLLFVTGMAGYVYLTVVVLMGALWLGAALYGYNKDDPIRWAKKMFGYSLLSLLATSLAIATAPWLP